MTRDNAGVYVPPPLLYVIPFLAGILLHVSLDHDWIPPSVQTVTTPLGIVLMALGLSLLVAAMGLFRRAGTSPLPFRPTTAIVASGPYRFTRNPMYLGLAFLYLGLPLVLGYAWPYLFFPGAILVIDRFVIACEERYLEEKFGSSYVRYRDSVRRWI